MTYSGDVATVTAAAGPALDKARGEVETRVGLFRTLRGEAAWK